MSKIHVKPKDGKPKDKTYYSKMAKRPNFLQATFKSTEKPQGKSDSLKLEEVGEDNLILEEDDKLAPKVKQEDNQKEAINNNEVQESQLQPCSIKEATMDDKENNKTGSRRYKRISPLRLILPIFILLSLLALIIINVLVIKGIIGKNSGCTCSENDITKCKTTSLSV